MAKSVKLAPNWLIFCALFARGRRMLAHIGTRFCSLLVLSNTRFYSFWEKTYDVSSRFRRQNASLHTKIKVCTQECKFCTSKNGYQLCIETAGFCSFLLSISVIYRGIVGVVRRRDLTVLYFLCQQLSSRYFNPLKIVILF